MQRFGEYLKLSQGDDVDGCLLPRGTGISEVLEFSRQIFFSFSVACGWSELQPGTV